MKKIFMVSLVAMMAVTAANADIASTTYVDTYVDTRAGEMIVGQDGKLTDANYAAQNQTLKVVAETDTLNAAIGKLDAAIDTQKGNFEDELDDYVKKADAKLNQVGTTGSYIELVSQLDGKVSATQKAFETSVTDDSNSESAPTTAAVATYVKTKTGVISSGIGKANEEIAALKDRASVLEDDVDAKVDAVQGIVTDGVSNEGKRLMATKKDGTVEAVEVKDAANQQGAFVTGLQVADDGSLEMLRGKVSSVEPDSITSEMIKNGEVKTADIADKAVTTAKIADKAVTNDQLSDEINASLTSANSAMQESALKGLTSWTDQKCATAGVTCSLVSKSGTIAWEAVKY